SPANNPGDQFAHSNIGVGISATRDRDHGGKFRITKTGKGTADGGYHKRKRYGRSRSFSRSSGRAYKQTGANNGANTKSHEIASSQGSFQTLLIVSSLRQDLVNWLFCK